MLKIVWTDYLQYRMTLRGFDVAKVEHILRHSEERYLDTATGRMIAVGRDYRQLLMLPTTLPETMKSRPLPFIPRLDNR
jgi:hypothetical protein